MAQDLWSLKEDGYLNVELDCESIVYHPTLNIILVTTRSGYVHVLDVNSGVALQTSSLSVKQNSHLICRYLEDQNKVLFLDGQALGVRSDYNGVLLLDTILQRRLKNSDELVKLELLLSEAVIFQQSLKTIDLAGTDIQSEVTNELSKKISQAQSHPKTGIKAQKWNTICLEVRLSTLRAVAQRVVSELKRLNRHVPALAIAAAINERLSELAPRSERCAPGDRALMYSEAKRRETFARWPHMDYKWALPEQMAQAGFYHQPNSSGDDRAMCFTCAVCLVCWERTDEPWSEHERHSPCCPFVKGEYTQNVPLSVTYATSPALDSTPRMVTNIIANSNVGDLIALGHSGGMVSVYSVAGKLKRTHCFCVTHADHYIPEFKNSLRRENIVMLTALSIVGEKKVTNSQIHKTPTKSKTTSPQHSSQIRPSIICGITVTTDAALSRNDKAHVLGDVNSSVQALNDHNQQKNELVTGNCLNIDSSGIILKKYLYLVVYDFQYKSAVCDQNDTETKNVEVTEIPEETNKKSDIFLKNCADILNIYKNDINEQLDTASNHATTSDPPLSITCDISPLSYKNFIPPENDKIFLPPEKSSETTEGHEGPRLCTDSTIYDALYMFDKDIDYSFTNGQLDFDRSLDDSFNEPGTSSDKSISDHISELKSKIETKTVSYSHAVQCIMLPESCQNKNLEIFEIIPTRDGQHILVVLRSKELNILATSYLLVYALDFTSRVIKIGEKPILKKELSATEQPEEVSMLPLLEGTEHSGGLEGLVALVCADGAVRLVDLATLNIVSEAKIEGSRYVSATYCNSLERLCVSTERGPLHFYAILGHDNDFVEERDDDDYTSSTVTDGLTSPAWPGGSTSTNRDGSEVSALITAVAEGQVAVFSELLNNIQTFNISELRLLTTLCQCEERGVGYCAVLPPCWSEMQQCQQRGKDATSTGGSGVTTRTWRLQTDATTWDEHVLELTLPWGACVGHVDLRFSLHAPCPALPNIQVTLLKQHASGIGLRKFASNTQLGSSAVDESVEFSLHSGTKNESSSSSGIQNPVLTEEYLRAHNADILAGPVSLSSCLDLTENGGCVTLTSPKLLRARGRTLLVHIKALLDLSKGISQTGEKKEDKPGSAPKKSRMAEPFVVFGPSNGGSAGGGSSSVNSSYEKYSNTGRKTDYYIGCDWLHEISITIRNMNTTNHPNERAQRVVMVESNNLVEVLCNCACRGHDARLPQMLALDILEWIAAVRLGRRGNELGAAMLRIIMPHLYMLIMAGFIDGTRSLAHKLTKLLLICIEGGRNMTTRSMSQQFDSAVLQALLRACAALGRIRSASALHWFTLLLQNVTPVAPDSTATECLELIKKATRHLQNRTNPYHQLLRSRFGLFAIPFEPELFDVDPPPLQKSTSAPVTFASVVSGDLFNLGPATNTSAPSVTTAGVDSFDPKELFNIPGISTSSTTQDSKLVMSRCRGLIGNNHTRGLLESEPLHYSCLSASDGTRMERFEQNGHTNGPGAAATSAAVSSGPFHSYSATIATLVSPAAVPGVSHQHTINIASEGTQKVDNDLSTNVEETEGTGIASMYIEMKKEVYNEMKKEVVFLSNNDQIIDLDKLFNPLEGGLTEISDTGMSSGKLVDGDGTVVDVIDMSVDSDTSDGAPAQNDKVDAVFEKNYQENCSSLSDKQLNEAMSSLTYNKKDTTGKKTEDAALAWQQLLLSPPQQMLVVERMHSGARRFVVLDFGAPVLLTDVLIPACSDLVSLSIDVWWQGEETDSVRLAIASDIGSKCLVLSDLQPPPLCRYMKITIIGRYGMSTTRCKIPIGNFYGHILVLPEDTYGDVRNEAAVPSKQHVEAQLEVLTGLLEDVNCRYTLACSKLKDLLNPLLVASNSAHMSSYFKIIKDSSPSMSSEKSNTSGAENVENAKILSAYQECVTFQHQLNLVRNVMRRLEAYVGRTDTFVQESEVHCLTHASTDKLHSICESLSSVLLSIVFEIGPMTRISSALFKHFDQKTCEELFMTLCVSHDIKLQLSVATLLVRMCGLQSWWGEFLTNCIMKLYSSNNTMIFPQERVFIIIAFLCRKSLSNGASRSAILDPTLRSLCTLLTPLADPTRSHFVAASIDLGLLGWLLLFLSFGLDSKWNEENSEWKSVRWDWLITETSVNKSQSHHTKVEDGYRRKLHKRFLRYKQHLDHLDLTQKAVQASTQAFSALSNHAASLSSKLEAALEQQESFFKKMKQISCRQIEDIKTKSRRTPPIGFQRLSESTIPQEEGVTSSSQTLNHAHCEAVARGLLTFMLSIDCSCSADLFLLACKTVARLVAATRPALMLQQLLAPHHLVELLRLGMQRETNPWISHAIACLLRDILDRHRTTDKNTTDIDMTNADGTSDMETDSQNWMQPSESETPNDIIILKNLIVSEDQDGLLSDINSIAVPLKSNGVPLPSLPESDDSEFDDVLDMLECCRYLLRKSSSFKSGVLPVSNYSTAIDSRLDVGLDSMFEIILRRLTMISSCFLPIALCGSLAIPPSDVEIESTHNSIAQWSDELTRPWTVLVPHSEVDSFDMLTQCFEILFAELEFTASSATLEQMLQLYIILSVNVPESTTRNSVIISSCTPRLTTSPAAISSLLAALVCQPTISLCLWTSAFQFLTLAANLPAPRNASSSIWNSGNDLEQSLNGLAAHIFQDGRFMQMLLRFLSGTGVMLSDKKFVGPTVCQSLHELLMRLQVRTDVVTPNSRLGVFLKEMLLRILCQLLQTGTGAIACYRGPLDAQCKFVQSLLNLDFIGVDLSVILSILESLGVLVYTYMLQTDVVKCVSLAEQSNTQSSCFGSLFSSVLGPDSNKHGKPASHNSLIVSLLKLATKLVQIPLPASNLESPSTAEMSTSTVTEDQNMSQTDESKVEQRGRAASDNSSVRPKIPCITDLILQQHVSTVLRLCHSLSACGGSSLAMLLGAMPHRLAVSEISEPATIADGVFQLLETLTSKATDTCLLLRPLLEFLSPLPASSLLCQTRTQLSEPLVWWFLQVLGSEPALREFTTRGGINMLATHLVRCHQAAISMLQPGSISEVMQHLSSNQNVQSSSLAYQAGASNSKKIQQANLENSEALINFAPLGVITSTSPTAQPADVLIQTSVTPHRRARTPQWSYHFYPDETHVELCISLPAAILLRELQLQPHLNSLATCPSAIALEVSRTGTAGLMPVCPPLTTSGMSFIRLHLPQPEVVTTVLIRLYRPRDSTNIGLLHIRLLGTPTFKGVRPAAELCDEERLTRSSLGWLRLLYQCFDLPSSDLAMQVVSEAAKVPNLLETCCGLLLIPTQIPPLFIPNLEQVLLRLSLQDPEFGLRAIQTLLKNNAVLVQSTQKQSERAVKSVCELIFKLCTTQDHNTHRRIATVLDWLRYEIDVALENQDGIPPCSAYVHCIASILWSTYHSDTMCSVKNLITRSFFERVYKWNVASTKHVALKKSIDALLCAMSVINSDLFPILLVRMSVLVPNLSTDRCASVSDDQKDCESMTDDIKQNLTNFESDVTWCGQLVVRDLLTLLLDSNQLQTIANASQSSKAARQLLDSGLPNALVSVVLDFCTACSNAICNPLIAHTKLDELIQETCREYPMVRVDRVVDILNFFADCSMETTLRQWLGSPDGSVFWIPLLRLLCHNNTTGLTNFNCIQSNSFYKLQDATIQFLSKCCSLCSTNQTLLAKCLCDVIENSTNVAHGISGFTRRLILQLLLENEKVWVYIKADETIYKNTNILTNDFGPHPAYRITNHHILLYLNVNTTLKEILDHHISFTASLPSDTQKENILPSSGNKDLRKEMWEVALDMTDQMSVAAGVTAKDKRAKDVKNLVLCYSGAPSNSKKKRNTVSDMLDAADKNGRGFRCDQLCHLTLAPNMRLGHLLAQLNTQVIELTVIQSKDSGTNMTDVQLSSEYGRLESPLQVFSRIGGLATLAQHLPLVYPDHLRSTAIYQPVSGPSNDSTDADWVKVEGSDDIYEDLEDSVPAGSSTPIHAVHVMPNVPPHSLAAFGLFLRLPGYADALLADYKKAQCLLRLVLGVTDDGEGGDIFTLPIALALPTLPFQVLRRLYDGIPVAVSDNQVLRHTSIELGVVRLLLNCLSVFTHYANDTNTNSGSTQADAARPRTDDKSHLYWAKGTGFGTGSMQQSWNVEQALLRQRSEEEHVTVLLQVLSSYINPQGSIVLLETTNMDTDTPQSENVDSITEDQLPPTFYNLLLNSCLLPALCSYLRNDSVLDMARHIPLYRAILQLLRAMASRPQLIGLLLPQRSNSNGSNDSATSPLSIISLLNNMKLCVDTYASRLQIRKSHQSTGPIKSSKYKFLPNTISSMAPPPTVESSESDEGLALLIPDIQATAELVRVAALQCGVNADDSESADKNGTDGSAKDGGSFARPFKQSLEQRYLEIMKRLQFDTFEMIKECSEAEGGGYQFVVSYHFENNVRAAGDRSHPARVKRLAQEAVTLATSLPLSYSSSVFVRCDTDRLDVMKVLITGPADTPYANGCFELDVYFPPDYPQAPMMINLETTGRHTVRFNPNLYNDGKVCLSVLNTWHGRPEEKWNAQTSSFLQVLVSIQSLILVPEPYFNEPGYERSRGTPSGTQSSLEYNANICQATVRWAMLEQIRNPCPCFKRVIHTHFWLKRHEIASQIEKWISELEVQAPDKRTVGRTSSKRTQAVNALALKHHYMLLHDELSRLKTPEGLEDLEEASAMESFPSTVTSMFMADSYPSAVSPVSETTNSGLDAAAPSTNAVTTADVHHDIDTDVEMEKMVSKVCE